jgi:hypothetical protein
MVECYKSAETYGSESPTKQYLRERRKIVNALPSNQQVKKNKRCESCGFLAPRVMIIKTKTELSEPRNYGRKAIHKTVRQKTRKKEYLGESCGSQFSP